ncbi:MAG: tyrosine-type recombinase/integrase [Thaumarchaeota archaeon]|nr:tyrosine-type recombinase/integrase [Nitrososphaerota archaeon]
MDRELLTKEQYLIRLKRRSPNTERGHKNTITRFEGFMENCTLDIQKEPLKILGSFVEYLEKNGLQARTINTYLNQLKKFFRLCYGIKLDSDDFKDFVGLPQILKHTLEPMTKEELRLILQSTRTIRRKALYWFIASTGARIAEALQVKRENFDFDVSPVLVTLPVEITKGKKSTRFVYLTQECTPLIRSLCRDLSPDDLVFTKASSLQSATTYEHAAFTTLLKAIKLNEKYQHNGRNKKNFHSIRAFTSSQIYNQTRDSEYSHAYIGHDTYLNQYLRKSDKERADMFNEIESALTVFSETTLRNDQEMKKQYEEELNEIKTKMEKYKVLDDILDKLEQPKLEELLHNLSKN